MQEDPVRQIYGEGYHDEIFIDKSAYKGKKYSRPMGPRAPHYRNKEERKELARLAQKAGVSIEKLLENKDIRVKLAKAQLKSRQKTGNISDVQLGSKRFKRIAAKITGLPVWHDKINLAWNNFLSEYKDRPWMVSRTPGEWSVRYALKNCEINT